MMESVSKGIIASTLAAGILTVAYSSGAYATTYSCTAVDNKAVLGTKDSDSVSITTGKKTCTFSVNGASVNQKSPSPDYLNALNALLDGKFNDLSQSSSSAGTFTQLLMGPLPVQSEKMQIENDIRSYLPEFGKCIASARYLSSTISFTAMPSSVENDRFSCKFISPQDKSKPKALISLEVTTTTPILLLGILVGDHTYLTFIPSNLIERGKAGYRLR